MEAPFGITFLKKAELYNLICRLDQQEKDTRDPSNALWPIEKGVLKWTYSYHKHLGSPIGTDHLSRDPKWSKLEEMDMLNSKGELKEEFKYLENGNLTKPLENLVIRGFAEYFNEIQHDHNKIVINREGLLVGEVLSDIEKANPFIKFNYFIYSKIMDHLGAFILLVVTSWGLLKLFDISSLVSGIQDFVMTLFRVRLP